MNNITVSLKKFITNKNTVTVIGVIIILGLLFWGYTATINNETRPVEVPVAIETIQPRTLITADMFEMKEIPAVSVSSNVIRTSASIIGQYSNINTVIPAGSMFYTDTVVSEEDIPGTEFSNLKEDERPYSLQVTLDSTYGNSLKPGDVVDIYMKANHETGPIMIGRLLAQVEILAVKDSSGKDVFEDTSEDRTPDTLLIGVKEDFFILLKKTEYLRSLGVELFPVPYGGTPPEGDIKVDVEYLRDYINSNTYILEGNVTIPEFEVPDEDETEQTEDVTE